MQIRFLLPLLALLFVAAAKKPPVAVRFHLQANPSEGAPFVMELPLGDADKRKVTVKKVPEVSEQDVTAVYPFQAADGSFGCAFKLDEHGRIGLETTSLDNRGKVLVATFNLRVVTAILIDQPVRDGVIFIPSGLAPQEIELLKQRYPVLGQPAKGKRKR